MPKKLITLLFFCIFMQLCLFAQVGKVDIAPETKVEKQEAKRIYSLAQFGRESFLWVRQPTLWRGGDWLKLGIVAAATAAAMPFDQKIMNATNDGQRYYYSVPVVAGRIYGEWYSIGAVAGSFGLYGILARDTAAKKISIELLQAGVYAEIATLALKSIIGRSRPYNSESAFNFRPFTILDDAYHSFPSGHATAAMALSTVMSRHAHSTVFKILSYVPAGFTLFSRMYQQKHWLSDEILGSAIGYFVGNWVVDLHEGKRHRINVTAFYPTTVISYSLNLVPVRKALPSVLK
jgi:membrane-associated phospholipid phosphatase